MITRVLVAALVGGIAMTLLGWLIFGMLMDAYYKAHMVNYPGLVNDPPIWIPLILFNLAFAWLIAFVFDYWAGIRTFIGGLKGGALIILPIAIGIDMQYMAFMNLYTGYTLLAVDVVLSTILGAIVGGIIGFTLGKLGDSPEIA